MDLTTLIEIIIAAFIIYLFIKFIVSPVVKIILGIIIFIVLVYLLQRFFGLEPDKILAPFGISLDKWGLNLNWIQGTVNHYIQQIKIKNFLNF